MPRLTHSKDAAPEESLQAALQSKLKLICSMNSMDCFPCGAVRQQVLPDDHSKLVPLLPIPNRTVKRLRADDSADSRVKVGHRQALTALEPARWITSIRRAFSFFSMDIEFNTLLGVYKLSIVDIFSLCTFMKCVN